MYKKGHPMPTIKHPVSLKEEERIFLNKHIKSGNWTPREVTRAKILLFADIDGPYNLTDREISYRLGCSEATVFVRRKRFSLNPSIEDVIFDKPRTGRPTIIDGPVDAHITKIACSTPPEGHAMWTLRLIREHFLRLEIIDNISLNTVGKALKKKKLSHG